MYVVVKAFSFFCFSYIVLVLPILVLHSLALSALIFSYLIFSYLWTTNVYQKGLKVPESTECCHDENPSPSRPHSLATTPYELRRSRLCLPKEPSPTLPLSRDTAEQKRSQAHLSPDRTVGKFYFFSQTYGNLSLVVLE